MCLLNCLTSQLTNYRTSICGITIKKKTPTLLDLTAGGRECFLPWFF